MILVAKTWFSMYTSFCMKKHILESGVRCLIQIPELIKYMVTIGIHDQALF